MEKKEVVYPILLSVRVNWEMRRELELIAEYELTKVSELIRQWIRTHMAGYERNPRYKKWLQMREARLMKEEQ